MVIPKRTRLDLSLDTLVQSVIDCFVWVCLGVLVVCVVSVLLVKGALLQLNHEIRKDTSILRPIAERFRS
mgnify:CR=1 FL=1